MSAAYTAYKSMTAGSVELEQRNTMVLEELPQVYYIASRILERLPQHVELEDLVHAGVIGLLEAHRNFDGAKNAQFKTFAKFRIRGAILDSLRELDWGSRSLRRRARDIAEATGRLEARFGRKPGKDEIAAELNMKPSQLEDAITQLDGLHIERQHSGGADGDETQDLIESAPSHWENPFQLYCRAEDKARLADAVALLSEREQLVLSLYYREELTMKEVASVVGIALSRVSQIHFAAISKLRQVLDPAHTSAGLPRLPPTNAAPRRAAATPQTGEAR